MAPTPQIKEAMSLYIGILEEMKVRFKCINVALLGQTNLPERSAIEYCYLELRMLCELMSLGCLVAHGDIAELKSVHKNWSSNDLIGRLDKLHPDFYPHPVRIEKIDGSVHLHPVSEPHLTKSDLRKLVGICGGVLHRGSLKDILKPNPALLSGLPGVLAWGKKITSLMSQHRIGLSNGRSHFLAYLDNGNDRVAVNFAEAPLH